MRKTIKYDKYNTLVFKSCGCHVRFENSEDIYRTKLNHIICCQNCPQNYNLTGNEHSQILDYWNSAMGFLVFMLIKTQSAPEKCYNQFLLENRTCQSTPIVKHKSNYY